MHDEHEETTHERAHREWDEEAEKQKIYFGDRVMTPNGQEERVTELDGEQYLVHGLGWFTRDELTKIE